MKVKNLQELLANLDPELDLFASDPNRSSIVWELTSGRVETVDQERQFGDGERHSHDFPIGYKFLKLF